MEKMRKMKKKILGLRGRKKEEEAEQQPQEEKKKGEPSPPPHHPPNHHPPTSAGPGGVPGYPSLLRPDLWKGHRAAADGDLSLLRRQLRKQPGLRDTQDPGGRTPLHLACAYGRLDVAAFLIDSKCQLDLCDSDMRTPLMKAVQCRQETCAIHLLECGADPNVADARGDTALHLAASTASRSLGQHLLDHGARLEAPNQDGITPLMAAVVENDCDMVEFLLKNGASVHAADKAGRTPLLLAVANKKRDASKLLLAYDSDVSHQDDSGWSARDYAELSDDPVLLQYIADYSKRKKGGESSSDALRIFSVLNSPVRAGDPGVTLGAPATNIEVIDDPSAGDSVRDSVKTDDTWRSSEEEELEPSPKKPSLARLLSFSQRPKQNRGEQDKTQLEESINEGHQGNTNCRQQIREDRNDSSANDEEAGFDEEEEEVEEEEEEEGEEEEENLSEENEDENMEESEEEENFSEENEDENMDESEEEENFSEENGDENMEESLAKAANGEEVNFNADGFAEADSKGKGSRRRCHADVRRVEKEGAPEAGDPAAAWRCGSPDETAAPATADPSPRSSEEEDGGGRADEVEEAGGIWGPESEGARGHHQGVQGNMEPSHVDVLETAAVAEAALHCVLNGRPNESVRLSPGGVGEKDGSPPPPPPPPPPPGARWADHGMVDPNAEGPSFTEDPEAGEHEDTGLKEPVEGTYETPVRNGENGEERERKAFQPDPSEGSFEEEKEKDDEEDGESPGVAAQPLHGPAISLNQIPPREESAKKGLLKLGAGEEEKEEEEEKDLDSPWDSESLPESPRRPTLPSLPASPAKIKTPMHTLMEEPGGSANVKPELDTMDLEPAAASSTLLKQGGAREKAQADLMEELGLDNADDIEDPSDWDSTSLSQGLPCPDAYDALTWGDPSHPAHLTPGSACPGTSGPARVEEATVMETSVALKGPLRPDINTEETGEGEAKGKSVITAPGSLEKESPEKRTNEAERIGPGDGKQAGGEICRGEGGEKSSPLDPALWEDRYEKLWVAQEKKEVKSNFKNITTELKVKFGEIGVGETPKEGAEDTFGGALEGGNEPRPPRPCAMPVGIPRKAESGKWKSLLAGKGSEAENAVLEPSRELSHEGENRSLGQNHKWIYDLSPDRAACNEGNKMRPFRLTGEDGSPTFPRKRPDRPPAGGRAAAASEALLWTFLKGPVAAGGRETWPRFKGGVPAAARRLAPETGGRRGPSEDAPTGGRDVALERDVARFKSEVGLLQAAFRALEKEKAALQKEVQELARKKEPGNPETTSAANIQEETEQKRQADKKRHCFGTKEASRGTMSEENHGTDSASSSDKVGFAPVPCKGINPTAGLNDQRKRGHPRPVSKRRASPPALGDRHQRPDSSSWSDTSLEEKHPGKTPNRRNKAGERRNPDEELARENATLREEVATLRAELSRLRLCREEDERRHSEDNRALQEKTDELRKELERSEEALAQAVSQRDGQAAALKTEAARLATQMDHLKGDRERLESEADALRARLGAAARELEESQDSREGLERALQRERDEAQRLKDRLEDEARALREANGGLSQRLGQAESRANALEGELLRATHALRDKTLLLESTQRDLAEARGHAEELDGALRREKEQASQWAAKGEAVQERLAQLQSDNLLLRQQLEDLQSQGLLKERAAAGAQETFREIVAHLRAEAEKRVQQVEERNQELAARCADLREQIGRHEAGEANQEGALRQLQQELADALKKQSMSEASLEVSVRCRNKLEEDKQQLQEEIERIQSRLENEQRKVKELKELKQSAELRLEQEMKRSNELQKEYNGMRKLVKAAKKKLKEYENGEASPQASFNRGLKNQCSEIDVELEQLRKKADDLSLQLEAESARRAQLESANAELRAELFSTQRLQKSHDDLQKSKLQLEEEIVSLRHQLQRHAFDLDQAERYKRDAEDRAKQEVRQKLEEVNLFLQTQAASQEALENIRAANHAALRHQLETRIRDLESELGKLQRSQQEVDLLKESAHSKLERANEMLAESNARLLQERSRSGSLLPGGFWGGSLLADPIPETLSFGGLAFSRPVGLAGGLVNPAGRPRASKRRVEAYVAKMQKKMEQAIKTELDKSRAEMNAASARILSGSSTLLNQNPDPVSRAYQEYLEEMRKNLGI